MIITVKNADYSECSIGILVPNELRNKLEAAYSGITEDQIIAVGSFLYAIGYGGKNQIYSKLKGLFFPALAANLNEAIFDFKKQASSGVETTNLSFNSAGKYLSASGNCAYNIGNYDVIKLNTFAYSNTTKAGNSMDSYGGGFCGIADFGCYFGSATPGLLFKSYSASKAVVVVTASGEATTLNASDIKILNDGSTPSITSENVYPSRTDSNVNICKSKDNNAQNGVFGWAEGLTVEEGTILKNALIALGNALYS